MIACQRCQAQYDDDQLRYCGRCGSDMRPSPSREGIGAGGEVAVPSPDPMVGRVIGGRYRVLGPIGLGGMGAVYKVEHTAMGKIAALKMLHPTLSTDREIVKRFRREAEAISLLAHPSTVQVFDFGEADGCLYMVMELCRGEDLATILRRDGPMPFPRAAPLLVQVCEALAEAHEKGIVHRDLKPENVIVSRGTAGRDLAKVLDFGLAKLREREDLGAVTARGSLIGTPFYMSPEQIRSEEPDARSDVYSLGAMMYRMLTGEHPFAGPTPVAVLTQHLTDELVPPSQRRPDLAIDPRVDAIVCRCMAKKPADRFQGILEVRQAIEEARGAEPTPMRVPVEAHEERRREPSGTQTPATRLSREDFDRFERSLKVRRFVALATVPLLLAAAAVGAWVAWKRLDAPAPVEAEVEPNDTAGQANLIASGKTARGTIGKRLSVDESDRDFYRFHVERGPALLRAELSGIPDMDLVLELFDGQGDKLAQSDAGRAGDGELLPNWRVDGGDYYLEVREVWVPGRHATENVTDQYALTASWRPAGADEETEPDDAPTQAVAAPLGTPVHGFLHRVGDVDYYYPSGGGAGKTLAGEVTGVDGVDLAVVVVPPGAGGSGDPAAAPGARVFDAGREGAGEKLSTPWPAGGAAPLVAVVRKDKPADASGRRPALAGVGAPYSLVLREENASPPTPH